MHSVWGIWNTLEIFFIDVLHLWWTCVGVPYVLQPNHRNCFLPSCMSYTHFRKISKILFFFFSSQARIVGKRRVVCGKLRCFVALSYIKRGSVKNALKIGLKIFFPQKLISIQETFCKLFLQCISTRYAGLDWFSDLYLKQWSPEKTSISERFLSSYTTQNLYTVLWECVQY